MKRVVLSIGVATLLMSGTLVAGNEYDEPMSAQEQDSSGDEHELYAQAEQEYAKDLKHYQARKAQKVKQKNMKADIGALEKSQKSAYLYDEDAQSNRQKKALEKAAQKELDAWKEKDHKQRRQQARNERKVRRQEKHAHIKQKTEQRHQKYLSDVREKRATRKVLLTQWDQEHTRQRERDRAAGRYADLYKVPAWPTAAQFFENRGWFNTVVSYNYATEAYDSTGGHKDLTILEFGEQPIRVKDILLASKLVSEGSLTHFEFNDAANQLPSQYLRYFADQEIQFLGKAEEYQVRFDLARYAFRNDLAIGVQLPLIYRKHRLRAHLDLPEEAFGLVDALSNGANPANAPVSPNAFMRRYGQDTDLFLQDIWKEKGIDTLGGSAMGLGDVSIFVHGKIGSSYFDKMVIGAKVQIPFAKKTSPHKLWGPGLGNDGHTEFSVFSGVIFSYRQFLNPHIFLQGLFSAPAHIQKRVPKKIANPENDGVDSEFVQDIMGQKLFTFADRVELAGNSDAGAVFNEFDTPFKNLGDNITTLKITPGFEMQLRIGNMIERFLSHRGFLDVYYYFRFKVSDDVRGVNLEEWNPTVFTVDTQQIEHTAGFDYSYQFDHDTRFVAGLLYSFAGRNMPKTFNAHISLGFTFK